MSERVTQAEFVAGATLAAQLPPPTGIEIAFAGRSNVGKSSLMNSLLARKNLVRTSSTPGCTRQISFFDARLSDASRVTLVDLPGYGYAKRSKAELATWATLIEDYLLGRPTLAAVVLLVDVRRGLEQEDHDLLELLASAPRTSRAQLSTLVVATKIDKLPASQRVAAVRAVAGGAEGRAVVGFSAVDGAGRDEIWRRLRRATGLVTQRE